MRYRGLDLNLLVALDKLVELRSVSLAAEALHLSQSAMSSALSRLRDYFQDELMMSSGRGMVLTPKAEELAPVVRQALLHIHSTITNPPLFDPTTSNREFSVVTSDFVETVLLDPLMTRIEKYAPGIRLRILPISQHDFEEFDQGRVDVVIVADGVLVSGHPSELLFEDDPCVICSKDHPDIQGSLTLEQFEAMGHVTTSPQTGHSGSLFDVMLAEHGMSRRVEIQVPAFSLMAGAVAGTRRLAIIHKRLAQHFANFLPLQILPLPFTMPPVREFLQIHGLRQRDTGLQWFCEQLRHESRSMNSSE